MGRTPHAKERRQGCQSTTAQDHGDRLVANISALKDLNPECGRGAQRYYDRDDDMLPPASRLRFWHLLQVQTASLFRLFEKPPYT